MAMELREGISNGILEVFTFSEVITIILFVT
jgi:hypothetical protein